jgi:hypothetical protein
MRPEELDRIFPYFVFAAGAIMVFIIDGPWSKYIAIAIKSRGHKTHAKKWKEDLDSKRLLAYVLLFVGGLWTLQNLWLGSISSLPKF